jgi:DNA-directed RNA polymerase specialized sigma24 family protein
LVLRYYMDLTEQQTADLLGLSVGTVKAHAHQALRRLRSAAPDLAEFVERPTRPEAST